MSCVYDLHSHSTASDGTQSPSALLRSAADAGVGVLALTDHDTTDGLAEAARAAVEYGIVLVNGVEISVSWKKQTVHIVGLGVDPASAELQSGLQSIREYRSWRAEEIGRRLAKHGIAGAYEAARDLSNGRLISRSHFARFLVASGHAPEMRKVFKQFLTYGKPGYVAGQWASLEEVVGWINSAGGEAVIAHPARYRLTRSKLRRLIGVFAELGGAALEVVSGSHSRDEIFTMARHAADFSLKASQGSDYHGPETPWACLGRLAPLPATAIPIWQDWQQNGVPASG